MKARRIVWVTGKGTPLMATTEPLLSRRILIMAADGFEQSELEVPLERL